MNENIDLTKILKNCPKGFKLYSLVHGEVTFLGISEISNIYSINVKVDGLGVSYTFDGKYTIIMEENVFYFLQKTKEIGASSPPLGSRRRGLIPRH